MVNLISNIEMSPKTEKYINKVIERTYPITSTTINACLET